MVVKYSCNSNKFSPDFALLGRFLKIFGNRLKYNLPRNYFNIVIAWRIFSILKVFAILGLISSNVDLFVAMQSVTL